MLPDHGADDRGKRARRTEHQHRRRWYTFGLAGHNERYQQQLLEESLLHQLQPPQPPDQHQPHQQPPQPLALALLLLQQLVAQSPVVPPTGAFRVTSDSSVRLMGSKR